MRSNEEQAKEEAELRDDAIEAIAQMCHETNRAWCEIHGDTSQGPWESTPDNIKASAKDGVVVALQGATPEELHQNWRDFKVKDGWVYGSEKDINTKTHPCLVPYDELPEEQRLKDNLFQGVVKALASTVPE